MVVIFVCAACTTPAFFALGAWDGQYYDPGETLNPECAPTDANCDVNPVTDAAHGGTGLTSYTAGDLLYATSASTLGKLALGVDGKVLKIVGGVLTWSDDSAGTAFTADGNGIELSGSSFGLELDGASLAKSAAGLKISATYAGQDSITTLGTITAGTWNGTAIGDAYLTKSGNWTGTFDGIEGAAYLARANHTGTQTASTISDFSTAVSALLSTGNGLVVNGTAFGLVLDGDTLTKSIDGLRVSSTYTANWNSAFAWGNHASAGYAKLAGQAGGQILIGGTASGENLTLQSTSNATKGKILFGSSAYDEVNNRLGIGTITPVAAADIRSLVTDFNVMKSVQAIHGANQGPYIASFFNDTFSTITPVMAYYGLDNGGFSLGTFSGKLFLGAGGTYSGGSTTRMTIDNATGSIGIGTTSPTHKFEVVGGALSSAQRAVSVTGTLSSTVARQAGMQGAFTTSAGNTNENDGLFIQLLPGNVSSAFNIAGMFANTVAGTGTSVIGGTANYGVYGDVNSTTAGTNIGAYGQSAGGTISIGASGNSVAAKDSATNIGVLGLGKNTGTSGVQLGGFFGLSSTTPTFASGALMADNSSTTSPIFVARDNGSEVFRIDDGGRVGIGITSPQQLLDVSSSQPIARITNTTNLGTTAWAGVEIAKLEFYSSDPSGPSIVGNISTIGSSDSAGGVPGGDLAFFTKNVAGTLNEKMRINGNGNITMTNSASSTYSLRLTGTRQASSGDLAVASFENAGTSSADVLTLKQTGEAGSTESAFINFYTNLGLVGTINSNGSGVTSYNTTSDRRLKDNIKDTEYGIDDVLKIPVREYTMRQDPKALRQTGFIAQELAAVYPDAVSANGDDGLSPLDGKTPWSIDYGRLTPLLVKSIQDQQLLLGDITDKDGLSSALAEARQENPINAWEYIADRIAKEWRPLRNMAALRLTAIRGYFDEVFVKKSHQEQLCIGTADNETCLTKSQLDDLLRNRNVAPEPSVSAPPSSSEEVPPPEDLPAPADEPLP